MATPEQNTLLAQQLFQPATQVITNDAQQRTNLLARIVETLNDQRFKREQATQAQGNAVNLENLRAANSQSLADKTTDRQAMLADKSFDRQMHVSKLAQDAAELKELHRTFALAYPIYAQAAEKAGVEVMPYSDFEQSWDGIGELQAEMAAVKEKAEKRDNSLAAQPLLGALDNAIHELRVSQAAFRERTRLSDEDQAAAKTAGLGALQQAKLTGGIAGINDAKFNAGVAALTAGDDVTARRTFGEQAPALMGIYEQAQQRARLQIMNSPERRAEIQALNRDQIAARNIVRSTENQVGQLGVKNPEIGAGWAARHAEAANLEREQERTQSDADRNQALFRAALPDPAAKPIAPPAPTVASPTYKYPALSIFGAAERMNGGTPTMDQFAAAPANILAAPGRAVDTAGRLVSGGLQGLLTGNYTPPPTGAVEMAGRGLGSLLPTGPSDADQVQQIQNEIQRLTPAAGQPDAYRQLQYLRRLLESYSRPTDTLLAPAY